MLRTLLLRRSLLTSRLHQTPMRSPSTSPVFFSTQSKQEGTDASTEPPSDQTSQETSPEADALSTEQQLMKQLEEKDLELAAVNDRTLRVLAEMENVRMIARRDVDNAKRYGIVPFATGLLSVADNLGLALKSVPQEALNDPNNLQLNGLHTGVGATESELLKVFAQHGITRFGDVGDKFDPNRYQALFEAPVEGYEPGTVIDVNKLGYAIGDRILRPAEVGVCKAP